jgi:hypothetical protein
VSESGFCVPQPLFEVPFKAKIYRTIDILYLNQICTHERNGRCRKWGLRDLAYHVDITFLELLSVFDKGANSKKKPIKSFSVTTQTSRTINCTIPKSQSFIPSSSNARGKTLLSATTNVSSTSSEHHQHLFPQLDQLFDSFTHFLTNDCLHAIASAIAHNP